MKKAFERTVVAFVFLFAGTLPASSGIKKLEEGGMKMEGMEHSEESGKKMEGMEMKHSAMLCTAPVKLTKEAEKKLGGRLYDGPLPKAAKQMTGMKMGVMSSSNMVMTGKKMKEMQGSHNVHKGFRGGEFIMVPNQIHHMEVVYSHECGFQVFLYNAFTEPVRADRFQAFVLVLPESGDDFFQVMRFLAPSADGSFLQTPIAHQHDDAKNPTGAFEVEIYMKFPEDIQPRKFDLIIEPGTA